MNRPQSPAGSSPRDLNGFFVAGLLALFNAALLGLALARGGQGAAQLIAPEDLGRPVLLVEVARLLIAGASLAAIYEFDARLGGAAPRVMRIATEIGVISTALLFTSAALCFHLALTSGSGSAAPEAVAVISRSLGLAVMPGLGAWAALATFIGCRGETLPLWLRFAAAELALVGAAAFVVPQLAAAFVAVLFAFWVGLSAFFARDEGVGGRSSPMLPAGV